MSNSFTDDSQESRGVTVDGTPLGVQARLLLSFDETTSENLTEGIQVWQQLLQAVASGNVHADVTLKIDAESCGPQNAMADVTDGIKTADGKRVQELAFTDVSVNVGDTTDENGAEGAQTGEEFVPTRASLAGATIAGQQRRDEADRRQAQQQEDRTDDVYVVPRRAIIAMRSKMTDAAKRFRSAIVSLDAVPGNQVEGISPLYHVMGVDSSDASAAVIQMTTKLKPHAIVALLDSLLASHEGAVALRLVDVEGEIMSPEQSTQDVTEDVAYAIELPLSEAKKQAEILAPWLDMDPDAQLDGDPVSFLLAMAPDAARVGKVDDRWILGDTQ